MSLTPQKTAFLFPGQGSQVLGMGNALARKDQAAARVFDDADSILGYSLSKLCWEGDEEDLNDTIHAQPALLTHSMAVLSAFRDRYPDFDPAYTAGHSLGEYSALVAAGSLSFPNALRLVRERGRAMKESGSKQPGGMAAVLGLDLSVVEEVCEKISSEGEGSVWVANDNCPGQIVISGDERGLSLASKHMQDCGARKFVRLAVSIASHSPIMEPAQAEFEQTLKETDICDPRIPTIGNVHADPLTSAASIRRELGSQLTSRVRWTQTIRTMIDAGVTTFLEMGSGNVLTGLLRRIDRSVVGLPLDTPESFRTLANM